MTPEQLAAALITVRFEGYPGSEFHVIYLGSLMMFAYLGKENADDMACKMRAEVAAAVREAEHEQSR